MISPNYRRLTPLFLGLMILFLIGGTWYRHQIWRDTEQQYLDSSLMQLKIGFQATTNMFFLATATYFDEIIDHRDIRQQMSIGNSSDKRQQDLARDRLYSLLYPSYQRLSQRNLSHLHFHLADGTSFLRFHRPEYYGDYVLDDYPAVRIVAAQKQAVHGFETGRSGAAFRNIFPLHDSGQFLGSVDLSVPFSALADELKQLMPKRELNYIIDRHQAEATLFNQIPLYVEAPLHPEFLAEDISDALPDSQPPPSDWATLINIGLRSDPRIRSELTGQDSFSVKAMVGKDSYIVDFLRIIDIEDKPVGYLVSYSPASLLDDLKDEYLVGLMIVWALSGGLGLLFILLARNHDKMAHLAITDALTGLPNRRSFMEHLELEFERFKRYGDATGLLMLDIDHFKKFNDTHGHAVGDEVLRQFSQMMLKNLRQVDLVGRLGGEEFAVLLPGTDMEGAKLFAERLLGGSPESQQMEGHGHLFQATVGALKITTSIGVTCFSDEDASVDVILNRADDALYQAKGNGRNRVETI